MQQVAHGVRLPGQWSLDAFDPINYAPYMLGRDRQLCIQEGESGCEQAVFPKHLLVHDGIVDHIIPNRMKDDLALAMSLPDAKANGGCTAADACGCSGIWRFAMSDYDPANNDEGHFETVLAAPQQQLTNYVNSGGTEIATPALCCHGDDCVVCGSDTPIASAVCDVEANSCIPVPPSATPTPGASDCCQVTSSTCTSPGEEGCADGVPVYDAFCDGGAVCVTRTPTPTPGVNDCCQRADSCGVPPDGLSCRTGTIINFTFPSVTPKYNMVCDRAGLQCGLWGRHGMCDGDSDGHARGQRLLSRRGRVCTAGPWQLRRQYGCLQCRVHERQLRHANAGAERLLSGRRRVRHTRRG